ncbi:MAG: right-handed parallel beta-helix repeat-containing protein [Promethearchaeota archaeon]
MSHKKSKTFIIGCLILFLLGFVFYEETFLGNSDITRSSSGTKISPENLTPSESSISSDLTAMQPQIISNETQLAALASNGDGQSWETAYIIENWKIEQNISNYGIFMANISQYVIFRNIYINNNNLVNESSSLLLENVENLRVENCYFRTYPGGFSWGIKIEDSNAITLQDVYVSYYSYGIYMNNSFNCLINESRFENQIYSQLSFKDCQKISILNNQISCPYTYKDVGIIHALDSWNVSECEIIGNSITSENQDIFLWETNNIKFSKNKLPNTAFYEVCNLEMIDNELFGGLDIGSARNVSIVQNLFHESDYGITGRNMYNFIIEQNTFQDISGEIFHFRYFSLESYTSNKFWLEIPHNTTEIIKRNIIFVIGPGLWRDLPSNIITSGNIIIPHLGLLILLIVSLYCLLSILYGFFINRKKVAFIQQLSSQLKKLPNHENSFPGNNFKLLAETEKNKFQQISILIITLWGLFTSFVFSENYYIGKSVASFLNLFTGKNYRSDFALLTLLSIVEFIIFGFLLCSFTYRRFNKINRTPKVLPPMHHKLTKIEKFMSINLAVMLILLIILTVSAVYRGNYPAVALIFGILSTVLFIFNLVFKIVKKTHYLAIELLLLGIILIVGYLIIVASIDPSIISMKPPSEVYATGNLISWGFIISGCIAALRTYLIIDSFKMEQGGNKFDVSEKQTEKH